VLIPVVKLGLVPEKVPPFAKVAEFVTESVCVVRDDRVRLGFDGVTILETVSDDTNSVEKEPLLPDSVCTVKEDKTRLGLIGVTILDTLRDDTNSVEKVPDLAPKEIVLIALELVMLLTSSVPPIVTLPVVSNVFVIISFEFVILELLKILMLPIVAVILLVKDALEA